MKSFNYNNFISFIVVLILCSNCIERSDCIQNATLNTRRHKQTKYSVDDLLSNKFEFKTSEDIDMDPCKAGKNLYFIPEVDKRASNIYIHTAERLTNFNLIGLFNSNSFSFRYLCSIHIRKCKIKIIIKEINWKFDR